MLAEREAFALQAALCANAMFSHYPSGPPRGSWLSGESGGIGRLNDDAVISQCASIAEREAMLSAYRPRMLIWAEVVGRGHFL